MSDANAVGGPRIHYVANVRLPSERANAYQILQQCDALLAQGAVVALLAPRRHNRFHLADAQMRDYYGLRREPPLRRLFTIDLIDRLPVALQRAPFVMQSLTFAFAVRRRLRREDARIIYSRDPWTLALLARGRADRWRMFYEVHDLPQRDDARRRLVAALRRCAGVVAISHGLRDDLIALGIDAPAIAVLPDGYDPRRFAGMPAREAARAALGLAAAARLVLYTGHLFAWKGVDTLVAAAVGAPFEVILVGGRADDRRRVEGLRASLCADNVRLVEPVPPAEVPRWLAAADVLVLPNSAREVISARYTSPLKLFEYMAAERPIVAADLPSLREVLDDDCARMVAPDDPAALRQGIEQALSDVPGSAARARSAFERVREFTWDARARGLIAFVMQRIEESP